MRTTFVPGDDGVDGYRLLTALVVPRPIAWIGTTSADGVGNLAPYSFYSVASGTPPMVLFTSIGRKDTLRNVLATGEFVVNVASEAMIDAVNASSAGVDAAVDEAGLLDLATEPSDVVAVPRLVDAPASLECRLVESHRVGDGTVVIGEVVAMSVRTALLDGTHPRFDELAPVSRLGDVEWGLPPAVVRKERPA